MALTLDDLTTPLTVDEVKTAIYDAMAARGVDATSWKPGATVRTMIAGIAIVLAAFSSVIALIARSGFLSLSSGPWLTLTARYIYNTERIEGTFATGNVTIDNSSGNVYAIAVGDLVVLNSTTNATYRNTAVVNIAALETGVVVPVQSDQLGSDGDASATEIDTFVTPLLGLTVTNPSSFFGTDEESDPDLLTRAQERTGALSPNGPADAYSFFARSATRADGTAVGVTRTLPVPDGSGGITLYVATATGGVTGTYTTPGTDLGDVHAYVETNAVPLAVTLTTATATTLTQNVVGTIWVTDELALDDATVEANILAALEDFMSTLPIGGVVVGAAAGAIYLQAVEGVISSAVSGYLVDLDITTPSSDITLTTIQAAVMGTLTLTINRVAV